MCTTGTTRTRTYDKICPNGTGVVCKQPQVCTTSWWVLKLFSWWSDTGAPVCPACPKGPQKADTYVRFCCLVGARLLTMREAADVLIPHDIPHGILPPQPKVPFLYNSPKCIQINQKWARFLLQNLKDAKKLMRSMGLKNWIANQDKAIKCLEDMIKEFGW